MDITKAAEMIAEKGYLTKTDLKEIGLSKTKIQKIKSSENFKCIEENMYLPVSADEFDKMGVDLILAGRVPEAEKFLVTRHTIAPHSLRSNILMFYLSLYNNKFDNIKEILDNLINESVVDFQKTQTNFYIYLLSFMINLPEPYKTMAKKLKPEDCIEAGNKVMQLATAQLFGLAKAETDRYEKTFKNALLSLLLARVGEAQSRIAKRIYRSIENGELKKALTMIKMEKEYHHLNNAQTLLRILLTDIIMMETTGFSSTLYSSEDDSILNLLESRNYKRARNLIVSNQSTITQERHSGQLLVLLLDRAIELRSKLLYSELYPENRDNSSELEKMLSSLQEGKKSLPLHYLDLHLKSVRLDEYYYLIENLIQISIAENDTCFDIPMTTLSELTSGYRVDIPKYLNELEKALNENRYPAAKCYLNIVAEAISKGHSDLDPQELSTIIESYRETLEKHETKEEDSSYTIRPTETTTED